MIPLSDELRDEVAGALRDAAKGAVNQPGFVLTWSQTSEADREYWRGIVDRLKLESFVRARVLELLSLRPCHVTGQHNPNHHLEHSEPCGFQRQDVLARLLEDLGISIVDDVRREDHPVCGWCSEYGEGWPDA